MSQLILQAENLKKYYDDRLIFDIPYLEFEAGGIYALVGPNGAGKTTLLRVLNLLEPPTEGKIYFDGHEVENSPQALEKLEQRILGASAPGPNTLNLRRQMTLVMQSPVLFRTSVGKNVAYGLRVRSYGKKTMLASVSAALNTVGLAGFEHRKARRLSVGEAQRVAMARALVLEPRILFLDEPTANVDRRNVQILESLIKRVNTENGTTIIFTTHDLSQAYRLTNKIISLLDGRLISSSPENIFYGKIKMCHEKSGFIHITPSLRIEIADCKPDGIGIYIDPRDIVVFPDTDAPAARSTMSQSDQWNCLSGCITSIHLEDGNVRLTVNAGVELVAIISKDDFQKISPDIFNQNVYTTFKASDVHVF